MRKNGLVVFGLILLAVVLPVDAAIQVDSLEIRGSIATGSSSWTADNFPGLWYDLKDNLKTESLNINSAIYGRIIPENSLWYNTSKAYKMLKVVENDHSSAELLNAFPSGTYEVVGWQGKPYVAVKNKANKLSKLVIEQGNAASDKKTLAVGEAWNIGDGWALSARGVNTNSVPMQAWLVLSKDGAELDNIFITQGEVYVYVESNLAGETDVPLFVTYVDSIYSDTTDKIQLRYTWAVSKNITEIKSGDTYGNLKVSTADENNVTLYNKDKTITLTRGTPVDITGNIKFKVADSDDLRFYPLILVTDSGMYDVRGHITTESSFWDATDFAALWYDLRDNLKTEKLAITEPLAGREIPQNSLWYNTTKASKMLKVVENGHNSTELLNAFPAGNYEIVGWQGEPYVAVKNKANKLSKLVLEQGDGASDIKTLEVGEAWDIGDGWTLSARGIDARASPRQAWLTLSKDGTEMDNKSIAQGDIYTYNESSLAGETNVPLFVTYIDSIFAGEPSDMVQLRYTWAISRNITIINVNDVFGNLTVATANSTDIRLKNKDTTITLAQGATPNITGNIKFRVADSAVLRYYPFVAYEVVNSSPPPLPPPQPSGGLDAIQADRVEIRGTIATGASSWSATSLPGFWYDLKDDLKTEKLAMTQAIYGRTIPQNSLWYNTTKASKMLKVVQNNHSNAELLSIFPAGRYDLVGWQGEPYVAVRSKANKLSKLVIEQGNATSDKKTLAVGDTWNIGDGWALSVKSIDDSAFPMQAWLSLSKDGIEVNNRAVDMGGIYIYADNLAGELEVPLVVTYIDRIYADETNKIVQLRYTWAISKNVTEIKVSDVFGNLEVQTADENNIQLFNKDKTISLTRDSTVDVIGEIKFKVADSDTLRFYPMVLRTTPGTYEVRGSVATGESSWNATNFAGFWYDLKNNLQTESLAMTQPISGRTIPQHSLWYNTTKAAHILKVVENGKNNTDVDNAFTNGQYQIVGWQATPYVAVNDKANKLAKLVIEQGNGASDKKTLSVGETWDVGDGWTVSAQSIDAKASPRQVWLVLSKDGIKLDDKIIQQGQAYAYVEKGFAGESDAPLFVTYVDSVLDSVFTGATSDMVQLRYTWAIAKSVTEIKSGDTYGNLEVQNADENNIVLFNKDKTISLTRNASIDITGSIKFRVADNDTLRFYPFVTYTIPYPVPPPPPSGPFDTLRFEPKKWSLVSVPKMLENPAVDAVFSNLSGDMNNMKWYYNGSAWKRPSTIEPLKGYWVYNNASAVIYQKLNYRNTQGPVTPPSTALVVGWNLIGMSNTSAEPMPMESALMTIDGKYSHLLAYDPAQTQVWTTYTPADSPPRQLEPGRGYWIFMVQDATYGAVGI